MLPKHPGHRDSGSDLLTEWKHHLRPSFFFKYQVENGVFVANPLQERTILMRKEGESAKSINEMLLSRLSRYRASPSATLAALTGSTISNTLKEDQAGALSLPDHLHRCCSMPSSPRLLLWAVTIEQVEAVGTV